MSDRRLARRYVMREAKKDGITELTEEYITKKIQEFRFRQKGKRGVKR